VATLLNVFATRTLPDKAQQNEPRRYPHEMLRPKLRSLDDWHHGICEGAQALIRATNIENLSFRTVSREESHPGTWGQRLQYQFLARWDSSHKPVWNDKF
jgi:hypothetical protein